jgi:hypothetical protein
LGKDDKHLIIGTKEKQKLGLLTLSSFSMLGLVVVVATITLTTLDAVAQTTSPTETEKKDIFKVIMTVQGLDHNDGDIVAMVSVNGESRVKLFDDSKTYIHSVRADGTGGIIEYVATFPNTTVNVGDEYKVCALIIKNSNLMCETGTNSPALRPEIVDLYIREEGSSSPTPPQAAMASDVEEEGE